MPEGPEIHRAAKTLSNALRGKVLEEVFVAFPHLKARFASLQGRTVLSVEAEGKAILHRFDNGMAVYSHNQLYGQWRVNPRGQLPETTRQLRLAFHTSEHSALLYSASEISLLRQDELDSHPYLQKLGPDVLKEAVTLETVSKRLDNARFQGRSLTSLLLDQGFLAGLGNYLRSELLFVARIGPDYRLRDCSDAQKERLSEACLRLPRRSFETGGITNTSALVDRLRSEGKSGRELRFSVFEREGQPCYTCGEAIQKMTAGGRRLYVCPTCQPPRSS